VSQSEEGFELVYQSSAVTPLAPMSLREGEETRLRLTVEAKDA
jgi:predicted DNA-binding antitoxin AbrB/MazE fold protein